MFNTPVGRFRVIAFIEGISFLVLLLIAMPIKYVDALGKNPTPVLYVGWVHGVLFMLYAAAGFAARSWDPPCCSHTGGPKAAAAGPPR